MVADTLETDKSIQTAATRKQAIKTLFFFMVILRNGLQNMIDVIALKQSNLADYLKVLHHTTPHYTISSHNIQLILFRLTGRTS
jgi:glutamate/tyrosine decarboxylase-like PLP-dependent enzyme